MLSKHTKYEVLHKQISCVLTHFYLADLCFLATFISIFFPREKKTEEVKKKWMTKSKKNGEKNDTKSKVENFS